MILLIITWKYLVFVVQTLIYELFFFFAIVVKNYSNDSHQNAKCKKNAYMLLTDFCDALSYCISDGLMAGGLADARRRLAQGQAGNGPAFLIAPNRMSACKLLTWDAGSTPRGWRWSREIEGGIQREREGVSRLLYSIHRYILPKFKMHYHT